MKLGIRGKNALITGGASGIGKAIAKSLAEEGVKVIITSRNHKKLNDTLQEIGGKTHGHLAIVCDITKKEGPQKLADEIHSKFGNLDIVVNNVGGTLGIMNPYCSVSEWQNVYRLNLEVAIEINNLFLPYMKKQNWGRIVNISAGSAMENNGPITYCAMKAALTAYSRCMGRILAIETDNVVMSALQPGVIFTEEGHWSEVMKNRPKHAEKYLKERCPLGRFGEPNEISSMVVFLCSELASFCQGAIVPIDGAQAKHYFNVQGI